MSKHYRNKSDCSHSRKGLKIIHDITLPRLTMIARVSSICFRQEWQSMIPIYFPKFSYFQWPSLNKNLADLSTFTINHFYVYIKIQIFMRTLKFNRNVWWHISLKSRNRDNFELLLSFHKITVILSYTLYVYIQLYIIALQTSKGFTCPVVYITFLAKHIWQNYSSNSNILS